MDVPMRVPEPNDVKSPAYFAHIVLYTKKFQEMVDWYCHFLGAEVTGASQGLAFLTYDDEHHRIAIIEMPDYKDREPNTVGMAHFAYTYASLGDLIHQYERLKASDVLPARTINHGPTTSMYYRDPDENAVEIQVDNFPSVDALNEWFATGEVGYAAEPGRYHLYLAHTCPWAHRTLIFRTLKKLDNAISSRSSSG